MASDEVRQVRVIVRALEEVAEKKVISITLDATSNLIEVTPRDTSWARSNWIPRIGAQVENPDGERPEKRVVNGEEVVSGRPSVAEQQRGIAEVLTGYSLEKGPVFISNPVPYITRLNDGHSKQAPAGFVQVAILKAVRMNT